VALHGNIFGLVQVTDLVEVSKDVASLLVVCTQKTFFGWGVRRFFVSDINSGGLFGHLHLALGANR